MAVCDGLDPDCPSNVGIDNLVPKAAVFQGGHLGKRLDEKGSDLISGIIYGEIHI